MENWFHSSLHTLLTGRHLISWGNLTSPIFDCDVGVGQVSAISLILSSLYLSSAMWAFYKHPAVSDTKLISYVDDATLISQGPTAFENSRKLWFAYCIFAQMLTDLGLAVEHGKTELFHFSHKRNAPNPPIDLGVLPSLFFLKKKSKFISQVSTTDRQSFKEVLKLDTMTFEAAKTKRIHPELEFQSRVESGFLAFFGQPQLQLVENIPK